MIIEKSNPEFTAGWHGLAAGLAIGALVGALVMHRIMTGEVAPEKPAAAQRQADGSLVLQRAPDAAAKPAQLVPKGFTVERVVQVKVQPRPNSAALQAAADHASAPSRAELVCRAVTVDLSLVRDPAGGRRVIASSPDGDVLAGVDVPIEPALVPPTQHRWAVGASYGFGPQAYGAWVERDVWRLRFGMEAIETRRGDIEGRIKVGFTF